jgi:hypothetical protein
MSFMVMKMALSQVSPTEICISPANYHSTKGTYLFVIKGQCKVTVRRDLVSTPSVIKMKKKSASLKH